MIHIFMHYLVRMSSFWPVLSETTGAVRKSGGNFKEKLRELGGLDAVFEVTMGCHSNMEV